MLFENLKEEFRPIKKYGKIIPGYYVSKDGRVFSALSTKFIKFTKEYSKRGTNRLEALRFSAEVPDTLFDDYNYSKRNGSKHRGNKLRITFRVHKVVMDTWKPIDENPPEQIKEYWNDLPDPVKEWIKDTAIIDHIDDNPENNHVDNLRWVTPKQNCVHRKKTEFVNPNIIELEDKDYEWLLERSEELGKPPQETFDYLLSSYFDDVEQRSKEVGVPIEDIFKHDVDEFVKNDRTKGLVEFYQSN